MFKVYTNLLPENIQIFFLKNVNCHYITRPHGKFSYQYATTNLKSKSVSVIGVKLWNRLSNEKTNITCLKKSLNMRLKRVCMICMFEIMLFIGALICNIYT